MDVKFLKFIDKNNKAIKRYQYTAIDDATRVRALQVYQRHNQANACKFVDYVIEKFPFRIHTICTDRGHEFQAKIHSAERQSRALSPIGSGRVLSTARLQGRQGSGRKARSLGKLLQLPSPSWCIRWPNALRNSQRATTMKTRQSVPHGRPYHNTVLAVAT